MAESTFDPKDEISHIYGPIWISSYEGAKKFEGDVVFVHHDIAWYTRGYHIPLLRKRPNSDVDRSGAEVNASNLGLIFDKIDAVMDSSRSILIHCKGGVERSPLAVACYLSYINTWSLDDSYEYIRARRPVIEDRRVWLSDHYRKALGG